jgi:hypothetical protein
MTCPVLDEAACASCSTGRRRPHGHVIVDEAQDLTPKQLRMLGAADRRRNDDSSVD